MKTKGLLWKVVLSLCVLFCCFEGFAQAKRQPGKVGQQRGFLTVKVTGKGETLEQAREDAKKVALAQVVGEAVQVRTEVKEENEKATVLSQILSASAGFIAKFDEIDAANNNGIFTVTANVTVYSEKLLEAVTFGNSSAEVDKEMQAAKVGSDIEETREAMTRFICAYLLDYGRIWTLTAKELMPGYDNNGQPVLQVNGYFGTSPAKYQMYTARLNRALARIGAKQASYNRELGKTHYNVYYCIRPDNQSNDLEGRSGWTALWVSKKFLEPPDSFGKEFEKYGYKFTYQLLDENGEVVLTKEEGFYFDRGMNTDFPRPCKRYGLRLVPLVNENRKTCYRRKCHLTFQGFASSEDMLRVKKVVVFVETVKRVREPALKFHQYTNRGTMIGWGWIEH